MVVSLLLLVIATIIGLLWTAAPVAKTQSARSSVSPSTPLVDQKPLQTARKLAALAVTPEEQDLAHEVLKLSDHEVDLAFADALREAAEHPPQTTPELRQLEARATQAAAIVKADQDRITQLTRQVAKAGSPDKDSLEDQLDILKGQSELDQDELDDASEDLLRAGGNPQGKLQRLLQEHDATEHDQAAPKAMAAAAPAANYQATSLWTLIQAWFELQEKQRQLAAGQQDALQSIPALSRTHDALEKRNQAEDDLKQATKQKASGLAKGSPAADAEVARRAAKETISSLHHFSQDQKTLSDLDKRIQDQQELADTYGTWRALVSGYQRTALHGILQSALWILLIVLVVYLIGRLIDRYFDQLAPDKKRLMSLRAVVWFAVQAVALLLAAFVVFGMPSQMPTILGLAGAGLTVALKDFIVGFVGWFVLMGKNGIRVGDWVEINGVGGEVVEIGLLRTVLLETGNWTDTGHPTGRKVSFVNSYAIEGHYFNFSTSGQWLWDELVLTVPSSENPYPVVDAIQKLVARETEASVKMAEEEWQSATTRYRVKSFSAAPSVNLRPTGSGVEIHVRYITRAYERQAMRARLYADIVELLHQKTTPHAAGSAR
ncbi:MAG TPA: mechanosensitive ion channel family protein [Terriglobales bacterium]|nr:mechanosensitive ion channel family protein [Terriglobales bacterium]